MKVYRILYRMDLHGLSAEEAPWILDENEFGTKKEAREYKEKEFNSWSLISIKIVRIEDEEGII